jgi:endonuclease/exonuclease/phosphatase (EEP) superfamily protein YafD
LPKPPDSEAHTGASPEGSAPRKKRRATGKVECGIGILLGLSGLVLSRAGHLWIGFDVFSQFTLHFAILTAAFAAGLLLPRAKLLVALLLVLAGVVAIGVWPHVASHSPQPIATPAAGERALKVASFNTRWINEDADRVLAEIERLDADIVTLLEVNPAKRQILAALKQRYPYQADCFAVDYCRLVILSKLPIIDSEARGRWEGPPFLLARLGPEAGGLSVMAVHTIRFPHSRAQFRQVTVLASLLEKQQGHKLVMGDFNATPFSRILSVIEAGANLRRVTFLPSWPATAGLPQIAIDHIFLSSGVSLIEAARIGEAAGSDHYPVSARIAVPLRP